MSKPFALYSQHVLLPSGLTEASILIKDQQIKDIFPHRWEHSAIPLNDLGKLVIMPGLIDAHVHINEPGRTDWEGFETATKAAAAGGITSLVDMPLNSQPVSTTVEAFQQKLAATHGKLHVNCGFWGGVVPSSLEEIPALLQSGVLGIKAFLCHSGIEDFPHVSPRDLAQVMPMIAQADLPLLVHSEIEQLHEGMAQIQANPQSYQAYLQSRPSDWEIDAIEQMIALCRTTQCKTHIVHLATADALPIIAKARKEGLPLSVETCPHYLFFHAEAIPDADTRFKCAPPIRSKKHQLKLWEALSDGLIDMIATDHSPAPPSLKELDSGNLAKAWGGISSLQFSLPIVWSIAQKRGHSLLDIARWMSSRAANFIGLADRKGLIAKGYDADLVIWDPNKKFVVKEEDIQHRHKTTPYLGEHLWGKVMQTYVLGKKVYENGRFLALNEGALILKS